MTVVANESTGKSQEVAHDGQFHLDCVDNCHYCMTLSSRLAKRRLADWQAFTCKSVWKEVNCLLKTAKLAVSFFLQYLMTINKNNIFYCW